MYLVLVWGEDGFEAKSEGDDEVGVEALGRAAEDEPANIVAPAAIATQIHHVNCPEN